MTTFASRTLLLLALGVLGCHPNGAIDANSDFDATTADASPDATTDAPDAGEGVSTMDANDDAPDTQSDANDADAFDANNVDAFDANNVDAFDADSIEVVVDANSVAFDANDVDAFDAGDPDANDVDAFDAGDPDAYDVDAYTRDAFMVDMPDCGVVRAPCF